MNLTEIILHLSLLEFYQRKGENMFTNSDHFQFYLLLENTFLDARQYNVQINAFNLCLLEYLEK